MATKKRRLSPNALAEVKADFAGLKTIPDYDPVKKEYEVSAIQPVEDAIENLTLQEAQMLVELAAVRDQIADKGTLFVQKMKGARQQIVGQYGDDSPELQKVGRIRASERATRKPKKDEDK